RQNLVALAVAETEKRLREFETKPAESGRVSGDNKTPAPKETAEPRPPQREPATERNSATENAQAGVQILAQIESLIDDGKYGDAKQMASELGRLATGSTRTKTQADASYCLGVIAFLSGGDDVNAEQCLQKALNLYQQESIPDEVGLLKTLFFIETLYSEQYEALIKNGINFNLKTKEIDAIKRNADELRKKLLVARRFRPKVSQVISQRDEIKLISKGIENHLKKAERFDSISGLIKNIKESARGERWGALGLYDAVNAEMSNLPRMERRRVWINNFDAVHKSWVLKLIEKFNDIANRAKKVVDFAEKHSILGGKLWGFGDDEGKDPWAYEFINNDTNGVSSLEHNPPEQIIYESPEWVVAMVSERAATGTHKVSRVLFYDTRTLKLIAAASLPNEVVQIEKVQKSDIFLVMTKAYRLNNFVDDPLVLSLIDVNSNQIDRTILSPRLGTWYSASLSGSQNKIIINCPSDTGDYTTSALTNPHFKDIKIDIKFSQDAKNIGSWDLQGNSPSFRTGALDFIDFRKIDGEAGGNCLASVKTDKGRSLHLLRGTTTGFLHDISLDSLSVNSEKVSQSSPTGIGLFSDGSLRYLTYQFINILNHGKRTQIARDDDSLFFDNNYVYKVPANGNPLGHTNKYLVKIDSSGRSHHLNLPLIPLNEPKMGGDSIFSLKNHTLGNYGFERYDHDDPAGEYRAE
ncbi:MAG: hypothetical protein WCG04_07055, partial [Alphaproteobacteria bacterium]